PGHTVAGRYDDLVSTIDLAPTILTACGVTAPPAMPGLNLLDAAAGKGHLPRTFVRGEIYVHTCVDLDKTLLNLTHRWVRQGDWKLIAPVDEREPQELYNLRRDPAETSNLLEEYRDEASRLAGLLEK
ncbi:MAG: sulfatase/phosphatase domain-containing protein, partial [Pirellulales bacterium]